MDLPALEVRIVASFVVVRKDSYQDSVLLMRISREIKALAGVVDAVVAMGTPNNRELLAKHGYDDPALASASANDLVLALKLQGTTSAHIEAAIDKLLAGRPQPTQDEARPTSLGAALKLRPDANLVLISLPGELAAREAMRALKLGRHVMLFSDNVPLEDEIALKQVAVSRGLLMMGPDCGTAIVNGKPLAFANVVRRGSIGMVGAAGTGLQEISSCIHRLGGGVSQAIGTGGRDLSLAVGGAMMLLGIEALASDPATRVLVIVSKPPAPSVADKVVAAVRATRKPAVIHFVGADIPKPALHDRVLFADSLAGAAQLACRLAGVKSVAKRPPAFDAKLVTTLARRVGSARCLRGLFCGGTTGAEALGLLSRAGLVVRSNLHKQGELRIDGSQRLRGHALLDLGDDVFTQGRPHPMIEPTLRNERLALELADPELGVLLFDVVLGFGSHADPAGILAQGVRAALKERKRLVAIASITGTDEDPQDFDAQRQKLVDAGVTVMPDNRSAALLAAAVLTPPGPRSKKRAKAAMRAATAARRPTKKVLAKSSRKGGRS
jgi:FdrA protein